MSPLDAVDGWDGELNAELYARFTRDYPMYATTSRDLAARASLSGMNLAVDLCGGTGITATILLEALPPHGRVISVDKSHAMQAAGRHAFSDPRITWITSSAEDIADHITRPADAVICNSAIWKTDTPATFAAVHRILRSGGRFVFNIGGGFAGLPSPDRTAQSSPSLSHLINAIAVLDYGYVPRHDSEPEPALTRAIATQQLTGAGFTVLDTEIVTYQGTLEEKKAWLSIPVFARPPGQFSHQQRLEILDKAYEKADKTQASTTDWLIIVAEA